MRLLLSTTIIATALSLGVAHAADLRPAYKAPPAPAPIPVFSWTGCYIGGHVGYGWGDKSWTDPIIAPGFEFAHTKPDGFVGGGQIGCDYQTGPWVFGIEGQATWTDLSASSPDLLSATGTIATSKIDALGTITGRVGYAFDRSLWYVKGGAAWARDKYSGADLIGPLYSASETRWGWTIGGGWEYAFAPNWSFKVEYNFMDFGDKNTTFTNFAGATFPFQIDQQVQTVLVGINYRFGDYGKSPVVARY